MAALPDLNYGLYFTLFFVLLVLLGMLFGFLRGTKNSIYALGVKILFYVLFFVTLIPVTNLLWTMQIGPLMNVVGNLFPEAAGARNFQEAITLIAEAAVGEDMEGIVSHAAVIALIEGLAKFILKIVYLLIYFIVFRLIYHLIFFIVKRIIFPKKERKPKTMPSRGIGAGIGAVSALLTIFVFLIFFGGIMSIAESMVSLGEVTLASEKEEEVRTLSVDVEPLQNDLDDVELEELLSSLGDIVDSYNANPFVQGFSLLRTTDKKTERTTPFHLSLFDRIFSFDYHYEYEDADNPNSADDDPLVIEGRVSFRKELSIAAEAIGIIIETGYMESEDLADISGDDIKAAFDAISTSDLVAIAIPVAIEAGADHYEDIELDADVRREIYAMVWEDEIRQLGEIAKLAFDLVNTAGLLEDEPEYETITLDGNDIRDLFDEIAESNLITLSAFVAIEMALDTMDEDMQAIITVPEGLEWDEEIRAFGAILGAIADTDITVGQLQDGDMNEIFGALEGFDTTIVLESLLFSHALKNVLSGEGDIEALEMIVAHDDIVWFDDGDDAGELRIILLALNEMIRVAGEIDFEEIGPAVLGAFDQEAFDAVMASDVLRHTIGHQLVEMAAEDDILTIPHTVEEFVKVNGDDVAVITLDELEKIYDAFLLLDFDELDFDDFGDGIEKVLVDALSEEDDPTALDEEKADRLLASDILHATISMLLIDMSDVDEGEEAFLVIPHYDAFGEPIRSTDETDGIEYIARDEFKNILAGILSIELDSFGDFEELGFDAIVDNIDTLLDSAILHATVSNLLIDMTEGDEGEDAFLVIPHHTEDYDEDNPDDPDTLLRFTTGEGDKMTEYIARFELQATIEAIAAVTDFDSFDDFAGVDDITLSLIAEHVDVVLASSIMQATITNILLDLDADGTIVVPHYEPYDTPPVEYGDVALRRIIGDEGEGTDFEYILKNELRALILGLEMLGLDDIDGFDGVISFAEIVAEDKVSDVLESGIIHATFSRQILDMGMDGTLQVPFYEEDGTTALRLATGLPDDDLFAGVSTEFVYLTEEEVEALIRAMDMLGMSDAGAYDTIDLGVIFEDEENPQILLASSVLQATLSHMMFTDAGDELVIPDTVRLDVDDDEGAYHLTYVEKDELEKALTALDALGLLDLDTLEFDPGRIFDTADDSYSAVLDSTIMHATISKNILDEATNVTSAPDLSLVLIVPDDLREEIMVDGAPTEIIERDELVHLLDALHIIGIDNFGDDLDPAIIGGLEKTELETIFTSGSLQITADDMLRSNEHIVDAIPDRVEEDVHGETGVTTGDELASFIYAVSLLDDDFTSIELDTATILALDEDDLEVVLDSMIIRNAITEDLETLYQVATGSPIDASHYHDNDTSTFLTKAGALYVIETIGVVI